MAVSYGVCSRGRPAYWPFPSCSCSAFASMILSPLFWGVRQKCVVIVFGLVKLNVVTVGIEEVYAEKQYKQAHSKGKKGRVGSKGKAVEVSCFEPVHLVLFSKVIEVLF